MFTGIVEEIGRVESVLRKSSGMEVRVRGSRVLEGTLRGDSISVNGVCQTVTALEESSFGFFASDVTLALTNIAKLKPGDEVNLERALTPTSRMGGHIVQGHVDYSGKIIDVRRDSSGVEFSLEIEPGFAKYIVSKGSITVDGISLTVVSVHGNSFKLYLIPETVENTTATKWRSGRLVNVEVDILGKYIESLLQKTSVNDGNQALLGKLMENGFV